MRNHKHVFLFWQGAWVKQEIFCAARSSSSFFHLLICNLKTQSCIRQKSACITNSLVTLILTIHFSLMFKWSHSVSYQCTLSKIKFFIYNAFWKIINNFKVKMVLIIFNTGLSSISMDFIIISKNNFSYFNLSKEIYWSCQSKTVWAKQIFNWK